MRRIFYRKQIVLTLLLLTGPLSAWAQGGKVSQLLIKPTPKIVQPTAIQRAAQTAVLRPLPATALQMPLLASPITGKQALAQFVPNWRFALSARLTPAQLDAIEAAFENTDSVFFTLSSDGKTTFQPFRNWNYLTQFQQELNALQRDFQITLQPLDWKIILGGQGVASPLRDIFTLLSEQTFMLSHQNRPPTRSPDTEETFLYNKIRLLSIDLNKGLRSDPLAKTIVSLKDQHRRISLPKTPQERLAEFENYLQQYGKLPPEDSRLYSAVSNTKYNLKKARQENIAQGNPPDLNIDPATLRIVQLFEDYRVQKTPQQRRAELEQYIQEFEQLPPVNSVLYQSVRYFRSEVRRLQRQNEAAGHNDINFQIDTDALVIDQLFEQYRSSAPARTAKQVDVEFAAWVKQYHRNPRKRIPNKEPNDYTEEEAYETSLGASIEVQRRHTDSTNPHIKRIIARFEKFRVHAAPQTLEEVYSGFLNYLKEFKAYPPSNSNLYRTILHRIQYPQDTPAWHKLYRLEQLARAAQRGERPWEVFEQDNPLKRPRVKKQPGLQETAAENFSALSEDEQKIIQLTESHYEALWENFPAWLKQNAPYTTSTSKTIQAFQTLKHQVNLGQIDETLSSLLDYLYNMPLGAQDQEKTFNHVIFRGENPHCLSVGSFHLLSESLGLPRSMAYIATEWGTPHITFRMDDELLYTLVLEEGATAKEVQEVIRHFHVPPGWAIRMGTHEIGYTTAGLSPKAQKGLIHLHIEKQAPAEADELTDISFTVYIDARALVKGRTETEILALYRYLFTPYLSL